MIRSVSLRAPVYLRRFQSTIRDTRTSPFWDTSEDTFVPNSTLPFAYKEDTEAFGQLVNNYHQDLNLEENPKVKVIPREQFINIERDSESFNTTNRAALDSDAESSKESRLSLNTIKGRTHRDQIKIPERITKTIYNHILALRLPKVLKYDVAQLYVNLREDKVYKQTRKQYEVDNHIAAFFAQDFASSYQVLSELFKRSPDFKPNKVLDVSYGPATGMIALNEIMGDEFKPEIKDSVILGHHTMQERAKLLLSRQINEYTGDVEDLIAEEDTKEGATTADESVKQEDDYIFDDFIGEVKTKKLKVKTRLSNFVSPTRKYDLIIAQHQLLQNPNRFPYQVDENVDVLLKSLEPNGILVIVERGSPLGFESVARARQIMIRPENYENESGKVPRPYTKGSSVKRSKRLSEPVDPSAEYFGEIEGDNQSNVGSLEQELIEKFGEVSEDDLKFDDDVEEISPDEPQQKRIDYHISVIAPCSHHKKCPLQTLKPEYYGYPSGKKLNWCHFESSLERPRYLLELKRGKVLSSKWESPKEISPKRSNTGSSGRENSKNYELTNYSYLIVQRSKNDSASLDKINEDRLDSTNVHTPIGTKHDDMRFWPRIIRQPIKRKGHVTMGLCASSGEIEKWTVSKSFDRNTYYDSRKASNGDLWGLDAKTKILSVSNQRDSLRQKLENYEKELVLKEKRTRKLRDKTTRSELEKRTTNALNSQENSTQGMIDVYSSTFNATKRQRQRDRRCGLEAVIE